MGFNLVNCLLGRFLFLVLKLAVECGGCTGSARCSGGHPPMHYLLLWEEAKILLLHPPLIFPIRSKGYCRSSEASLPETANRSDLGNNFFYRYLTAAPCVAQDPH